MYIIVAYVWIILQDAHGLRRELINFGMILSATCYQQSGIKQTSRSICNFLFCIMALIRGEIIAIDTTNGDCYILVDGSKMVVKVPPTGFKVIEGGTAVLFSDDNVSTRKRKRSPSMYFTSIGEVFGKASSDEPCLDMNYNFFFGIDWTK